MTIQNQEPNVQNENLIYATRNEVVGNATQEIFEQMINLEQINLLSEIISTEIAAELMHASFMTEQLELTEKQKERLNKIELHMWKSAGDITIPTRCLLVSTNCLDLIKTSVEKQVKDIKENL